MLGFNVTRATNWFGWTITRASRPQTTAQPVDNRLGRSGSLLNVIHEPFTGAWQRNISVETCENILKFSAVYACVGLISDDISKLRIKLVEEDSQHIWKEITSPAFSPVLRKPNRYQTHIQFVSQWITSKLLYGNTYILKERDLRNVVIAMYVLDPARVTPLVTEEGDVWYELKPDNLAQVPQGDRVVIPASEIIHDRMLTLWHPLVGVSPIYACGASATQGIRIQANSETFFGNMSRPSGILKVEKDIATSVAEQFKRDWEANNSGRNAGKIAVLGGGMQYEPLTIPAHDAQLIEQLRWTVEDVARCFHVPLHKLGMGQPTLNNVAALNQDYYTQTLQALIECIEVLLDEGLATPPNIGTELDLENLLRMDPISLADVNEKGIRAGYLAPNEARLRSNLSPVPGGNSPYMQQQNWSLEALAKRPAPSVNEPAPAPAPKPEPDPDAPPPTPERAFAEFANVVRSRFKSERERLAAA